MDNFSIRSSLSSHDNIHILNNAVLPRKMVEKNIFTCFEAVFGQPWFGCFVCSAKLETKMSLMQFVLKLDTFEHILEAVPGPDI